MFGAEAAHKAAGANPKRRTGHGTPALRGAHNTLVKPRCRRTLAALPQDELSDLSTPEGYVDAADIRKIMRVMADQKEQKVSEDEIEDVIAITLGNAERRESGARGRTAAAAPSTPSAAERWRRLPLADVVTAVDMPREERHKRAETMRRNSQVQMPHKQSFNAVI